MTENAFSQKQVRKLISV